MRDGDAFFAGIVTGMLIMGFIVVLLSAIVDGPNDTLMHKCAKENNVYQCEIIAVPKAVERTK